jgi:Skp family chaperone for outer membrane proteins
MDRWVKEDHSQKKQGVLKVTKTQFLAALAASVLALELTASTALGQQGAQPQAPGGIALLDVSRVFKEHVRFNAEMNNMKAEVQAEEAKMKQRADGLQQMVEELKELAPGSRDYKEREEYISKERANMTVDVQLQRKEFLQKEAKIYHMVYREIQQEVQYFASRYAVSAVLRFSNDQANVENPDEVLRDINKSVVWFAPHLDITNDILRALNNGAAPPAANPQGPEVPYRPAGRTQGVPRQR